MKVALAVSIIVTSIIGYNLWPVLDCFYICIALTLVLSATLLLYLSEKGTILRRVLYIWLILTVGNLVDELFFNPKSFDLNEYFFACLIIMHQTYLYYNARCRK